MGTKSVAVSALQGVGTRMVEKGATKAIEKLPVQKQNKVRGALMMGAALALFVSGLKLIRK